MYELFELRVLSGLHLGTALPLCGERWLIGSSETADLRLLDKGILDNQAFIQLTEKGWELHVVLEGNESNNDQSLHNLLIIEEGKPFNVIDVWLVISSADSLWEELNVAKLTSMSYAPPLSSPEISDDPKLRNVIKRTGRLFITACGSIGLLFTIFYMNAFSSEDSVGVHISAISPVLTTSANVEKILSTLLYERELNRAVSFNQQDKKVTLSGELSQEQAGLLQRMLNYFANNYTSDIVINNETKVIPATSSLAIRQISLQQPAYIVTQEGQYIFIGDEYNGMRLVSITAEEIEFSGKKNIKVKW